MTVLTTLAALPHSLELAPNLQLVQMIGAGLNHIASHPLWTSSMIPLANSSGVGAPPVAEWAILTTLAVGRQYNLMHDWQRAGHWGPTAGPNHYDSMRGVRDAVGQRVGVLGYGAIGRQTARVATALGMDVLAYTASPRPTPASRRDRTFCVPGTGDPEGTLPSAWHSGGDRASVREFLAQDLDVLVMTLPLTEQTRGLIGREEMKILAKKNALLVNISRGPVVDTDALVEALNEYEQGQGKERKGLRGAALDVTEPEPLPSGHPLWTAPNTIITPHVSGMNVAYIDRCLQVVDVNLQRYEKKEKFINLVDRVKGYSSFE